MAAGSQAKLAWPSQVTSRTAETVASHLAISDLSALRGLRIASIGEGFSTLAQTLEKQGNEVVAVDLVYALSRAELERVLIRGGTSGRDPDTLLTVDQAQARLPTRCLPGNVLSLPLDARSQDRVFISHVLEWLGDEDKKRALIEAVRVARPGGEVRVNGLTSAETQALMLWVPTQFPGCVARAEGDAIMVLSVPLLDASKMGSTPSAARVDKWL